MKQQLTLLGLISFAILAIGCSTDNKIEIAGSVSWNGEPVSQGYVELQPLDGKGQVEGAEIVDGKFSVRVHEGSKRVSVTAQKKIGENPPTDRIPQAEPIYLQYIPEKYNAKSDYTVDINRSQRNVAIELTGQEKEEANLSASDRKRRALQGGKR